VNEACKSKSESLNSAGVVEADYEAVAIIGVALVDK